MTKLKLLAAALVAAATLATPAMARESHVTSRDLTEDAYASTTKGADFIDGHSCYRTRASGLHGRLCGYEDRDVWGHWGAYYGPMIGVP
jgi:hypothetical protein